MSTINWDQVVTEHLAQTKAPIPYRVIGKMISTVSLISNEWAGKALNQLWFKPIGAKISSKDKQWLAQAQRKDIQINGKNVPVYIWGQEQEKAPLILAAHGWAGHGGQFRQMGEALVKQGYGFMCFDAPAHGEAEGKETNLVEMADVICELNHQHDIQTIIGHSVAGLAITYALQDGLNPIPVIMVAAPWSLDYVIKITANYMNISDSITSVLKNKIEKNFGKGTRQRLSLESYKNNAPTAFFYDTQDDQVAQTVIDQVEASLSPYALHVSENLGHNRIMRSGQTIETILELLEGGFVTKER